MHSYGSLFICNASMGAHSFMKATCCLVHCKGQCSRKPSYCNGHDPVCCKRSQPPVLKVMVVPWQPLKTGFAAAAWHQVSLTICFPWVAKMSGVLSWFLYLMDWFNSSCMPSSMGWILPGEYSIQDNLSCLFLLIFCLRLCQLNVGLSALLCGGLLLVQSTGWVC